MLWLNGIPLRSPSRVVSPRLPTIQEGRRIRRNSHAELRADKRTSRFLLRSTGSGKCNNTSTHRPGQSPVGPQWFPQFLFPVGQMLLKQWNGPCGHSGTDHWRAQRWPPSGLHHLWETHATLGVSGQRKEKWKATTKGTHQVKRHKDGMQELWCVRLRDVRLQTGLKKQANETHLGGRYQNGPREPQVQLTRRQREYLIFWKMSKNSSSGGGEAFMANKLSAHQREESHNCHPQYALNLFSVHFHLFGSFNLPDLQQILILSQISLKIIQSLEVDCLFQHVPGNKTVVTNCLLLYC